MITAAIVMLNRNIVRTAMTKIPLTSTIDGTRNTVLVISFVQVSLARASPNVYAIISVELVNKLFIVYNTKSKKKIKQKKRGGVGSVMEW